MNDDDVSRLFELADLILGIGRQIRPPHDLLPPMCTPVESTVMRFIDRNPGTSAKAASEATMLPSSNFSRVLRSLEEKRLVRREANSLDARGLLLYPTALAQENRKHLAETWSQALEGLVDEPETVDFINEVLRRIETGLIDRRRRAEQA